jgi:methionyl-tRNA formyltransferase
MLMNEGLDTGDILMQEEAVIDKDDTVETLGRRLSETGASLLIKTLEARERGTVRPFPQSGIPSYAPPLKKEHGRIDWTKTSREISSLVRGVYPWPGAYCYLNGERIKIIRAEFVEGHGIPSRIEKAREGEFLVGTGNGLLSIVTVQPEGKKPMSSGSFLLGRKIMEGTSFDGI